MMTMLIIAGDRVMTQIMVFFFSLNFDIHDNSDISDTLGSLNYLDIFDCFDNLDIHDNLDIYESLKSKVYYRNVKRRLEGSLC